MDTYGLSKRRKNAPWFFWQHAELLIFFFFLMTSLFLGDGKQPFVDAWWALGILMMYGVRYYQRGKLDLRPLPRPIGFAWAALIVYYIILIPFSDSAGYSITTTIRLIEAYLTYLLFYTISSDRATTLFTKGLLFVGVIATFASFIFLLSPSLAGFLPPMNLLYATYGHNHLADLLLMIFPIVITQQSWLLLFFFSTAMFFTFARGAWLLLIFYLLFLVRRSKNIMVRRTGLLVAAATTAVFLLVSLTPIGGIPQKPSLLEDGRWEYWRQSVEAIKERPLFGSGPGTFYLQSKRLQARPSSYSWFAHSFLLETTVEAGAVGLFMLTALVYFLFKNSARRPLLWGVVLVFIYSFYEFTLDYAAMWLLVWAALGTLTKQAVQTPNRSKVTVIALIVLVLFYVSSVGSVMASVAGNQTFAFFLAPYDANKAKELLEKQNKERNDAFAIQIPVIMFFHGVNPDVYALFIDQALDESEKQRRKETVASLDPWKRNEYNVVEYYIQRREWVRAQQELKKTLDMWTEAKRIRGYEADYTKKQELSKQMLATGDGLFIEKKPTEAAAWYAQAQKVDAWILAAHRPVFLDYPFSSKEKTDFFQGLGKTPGKHLGRYREDYVREYLVALKEAVRTFTITGFSPHAEAIVYLDPWIRSRAWDEVGYSLLEKAREEKRNGRYQESLTVLLEGINFLKTLTSGGQRVDWRLQHDFAEELVFVGNILAPSQLLLTAQAYQSAKLLVPWILSEKELWFEENTPEEIEAGSLVSLINASGSSEEWEKRGRIYAVLYLINKGARDKDLDLAVEATRNLKNDVALVSLEVRNKTSIKLQKFTDQLLLDKKTESAEKAIIIMNRILPEDYWVQAQLGHFYSNTGNKEAAKQAYQDCLAAQNRRNDDCFYGLQALEAGQPNTDRYQQVSQIIQGTASWRDF